MEMGVEAGRHRLDSSERLFFLTKLFPASKDAYVTVVSDSD
jgi:hypothetical protein